eukprot:5793296-Prymnesium_polylepis.1
MATLRGVIPARERWIRSDATSRRSPGKRKGLKPYKTTIKHTQPPAPAAAPKPLSLTPQSALR